MKKAYKTEIKPTKEQKEKINQSIGICRYLYNSYLGKNQELYKKYKEGILSKKEAFISANDYDKYINNEIKVLEEFKWIDNCGAKARKKAIVNAETAYKRFFKGKSRFPKFKKKNKSDVNMYFLKNNKGDFKVERHKIMIPTLKTIRLKEYGYIPINGGVSKKADKYFISITMEEEINPQNNINEGIGINLGIKEFAVYSNRKVKKNINKTKRVKKIKKS